MVTTPKKKKKINNNNSIGNNNSINNITYNKLHIFREYPISVTPHYVCNMISEYAKYI